MTHCIQFSIQSLFDDCVKQASVDFSATRASNPEGAADAVYEDFVLSEDRLSEFRMALRDEIAKFTLLLRDNIAAFSDEDDRLHWDITLGENEVFGSLLDTLFKGYLKHRMLAWWFLNRSELLYAYYAEKAQDDKTKINNFFGAALGGRKLRYF